MTSQIPASLSGNTPTSYYPAQQPAGYTQSNADATPQPMTPTPAYPAEGYAQESAQNASQMTQYPPQAFYEQNYVQAPSVEFFNMVNAYETEMGALAQANSKLESQKAGIIHENNQLRRDVAQLKRANDQLRAQVNDLHRRLFQSAGVPQAAQQNASAVSSPQQAPMRSISSFGPEQPRGFGHGQPTGPVTLRSSQPSISYVALPSAATSVHSTSEPTVQAPSELDVLRTRLNPLSRIEHYKHIHTKPDKATTLEMTKISSEMIDLIYQKSTQSRKDKIIASLNDLIKSLSSRLHALKTKGTFIPGGTLETDLGYFRSISQETLVDSTPKGRAQALDVEKRILTARWKYLPLDYFTTTSTTELFAELENLARFTPSAPATNSHSAAPSASSATMASGQPKEQMATGRQDSSRTERKDN